MGAESPDGRGTKEERLVAEEEGSVVKEIEPWGRTGLDKDGVLVAGLEERRW